MTGESWGLDHLAGSDVDAGKVSQCLSSYDLGLFSEPPSLGVGEAQPFVANLFTEYAGFLFEVIDCILL